MNQLACVVIVMTALILHSIDCHDESANVNKTGQQTNDKQSMRPFYEQRNIFLPKDRFNDDKIIFDRVDLYSHGQTTTDRPGIQPMMQMMMNDDGKRPNHTNQQYFSKANGEYQFR